MSEQHEIVEKKVKDKRKKKFQGFKNEISLKAGNAVYASGFPLDATPEQIKRFLGKAGVLKQDEQRNSHLRMQMDEEGHFTGRVLAVYIYGAAADNAVQYFSGEKFMESGLKAVFDRPEENEKKPIKKDSSDKLFAKKKADKYNKGALSWGFVDDEVDNIGTVDERTLVIRNAFHPDDFAKEAYLKDNLKNMIKELLEEINLEQYIDRISVYDKHPEGIITIKMKNRVYVTYAIQELQGKKCNGRTIKVEKGCIDTRASNLQRQFINDDDEEKRIEAFGDQLEQDFINDETASIPENGIFNKVKRKRDEIQDNEIQNNDDHTGGIKQQSLKRARVDDDDQTEHPQRIITADEIERGQFSGQDERERERDLEDAYFEDD
ncbi:MAG: hypothetical protein EZS28_013723 [Streblomastix strix]|uniref:RRM domain-containing protein n=1 Tax=Streblomastix strix TaxID=222440 RepID=A0A5J4W844_9EUKA|nr:MAG: hypothetical protein EZS28_013723 [Streblomastix strix]